jgi:hypothetical protein
LPAASKNDSFVFTVGIPSRRFRRALPFVKTLIHSHASSVHLQHAIIVSV